MTNSQQHLELDSNIYVKDSDLDDLSPFFVEDIILTNYVMHRISSIGYHDLMIFPQSVALGHRHPALTVIMQKLIVKTAEFEIQFRPRFENRKSLLQRIPEEAFRDFINTIHGIFVDHIGINWGRIIAVITFVGSYCQACLEQGMIRIVACLVDYAVKYIDQNFSYWIQNNGGWMAFDFALTHEQFTADNLF